VPLTVNFMKPVVTGFKATLDGSGSTGNIVSYRWTFDDLVVETGKVVTRTFDSPGSWQVTLVVTDPHGHTAQDTETVTIK